MLEQFEQEFMDKEEQAINPGLHKQMESSDIHDYKNLTPEMLENYIINLIDNEEKNKLAWDGIKDQLNEYEPIIYDGKFTKEMFLNFCKELCQMPARNKNLKIYAFITKTYKLIRDRLKKLQDKLNAKLE